MATLTTNEHKALQGIIDSDYRDGSNPIDCWVWSWSCNPFDSARTFGGVVASLVKKGMVRQCGEGSLEPRDVGGRCRCLEREQHDVPQHRRVPALC